MFCRRSSRYVSTTEGCIRRLFLLVSGTGRGLIQAPRTMFAVSFRYTGTFKPVPVSVRYASSPADFVFVCFRSLAFTLVSSGVIISSGVGSGAGGASAAFTSCVLVLPKQMVYRLFLYWIFISSYPD